MDPTTNPISCLLPSIAQNKKLSSAGTDQNNQVDGIPNSPCPQLNFVTITGPPSLRGKEERFVVRSHAMRAFLRDKKAESKGNAMMDLWENTNTLDDSIGRFKLKSWSRKSSKKVVVENKNQNRAWVNNSLTGQVVSEPKHILRIAHPKTVYASLDPFGLLPITLTTETQKLLHHYVTTFTMNSLAVNPEGSWMAFAATDAALLRATLSLVALHTDLTKGREESWDCLYQKGEAIKEINLRLSDISRQFNDTSIAAVAILTNIESVNGTKRNSEVHMIALEQMVKIRGGLDHFGHNKVLQRVLAWSDILYSSTWNCTLRFPFIRASITTGLSSTLERFSSILSPHSWLSCATCLRCISDPVMQHVLEMFRRISNAMTSSDLKQPERAAISHNIYLLEHVLLSSQSTSRDLLALSLTCTTLDDVPDELYLKPGPVCNPLVTVGPEALVALDLSEPFRLAALLYTHLILRELPHTARMHLHLVSTLKRTLDEQFPCAVPNSPYMPSSILPMLHQAQAVREILAWVAFVGAAAAAANKTERVYFIRFLRDLCVQLSQTRLKDSSSLASEIDPHPREEDLKCILQGVVWREGVADGYFNTVWAEMKSSSSI